MQTPLLGHMSASRIAQSCSASKLIFGKRQSMNINRNKKVEKSLPDLYRLIALPLVFLTSQIEQQSWRKKRGYLVTTQDIIALSRI